MAVPYLLGFRREQRYKTKNTSHRKWYKIPTFHLCEYKLSIKASTERLHPHRKCFSGQAECPWSPHGRQGSFSEASTTRLCGAKGPNPKAGTVAQ
jgi:hypothetical protein